MADTTISALLDAITPDGTEHAVIDQGGDTRKISLTDLVAGGIEYGTNTNGEYVRFGNIQLCWAQVTLEYDSAHVVLAKWTFPQPFNAAPVATHTTEGGPATIARRFSPSVNPPSATSVVLSKIGQSGDAGFSSGDTVRTWAFAIGTWS